MQKDQERGARRIKNVQPQCRTWMRGPVLLLTDYVEAKIHNITLALKGVNNLPVAPGAIFSFWHVVGRPTSARGFMPGRSLLGGQLRPDYGGGLCLLRRAAASVVRTATVFWVFPATGPWILSWTGEEPASGRAGCRVPRAGGPAETQANIVAADARRWVLQSGRTAGRSSFLQNPGRRRSGQAAGFRPAAVRIRLSRVSARHEHPDRDCQTAPERECGATFRCC